VTVRALARPSDAGAEAVERLRARASVLLPGGFEELEQEGRLQVVAYAESAEQLPDELGPWTLEVVEGDWAERWREFHHGRVIAGRLWVGPPWEDPPTGLPSVVIDPGQAFGTGGHGSTRATLELLATLPAGGSVLDLGCGSGVLAIAALRLGFEPVHACDLDPIAVEVTAENAARNGVALAPFVADAISDPLPDAPLWIANILRRPLELLLGRADAAPRAIVSGLVHDEQLDAPAYRVERCAVLDGWQAILLERR
jgi:ribosomal protein L11 methyltransferase